MLRQAASRQEQAASGVQAERAAADAAWAQRLESVEVVWSQKFEVAQSKWAAERAAAAEKWAQARAEAEDALQQAVAQAARKAGEHEAAVAAARKAGAAEARAAFEKERAVWEKEREALNAKWQAGVVAALWMEWVGWVHGMGRGVNKGFAPPTPQLDALWR